MSNEEEVKKMQLEQRKHLCLIFQHVDDIFTALENVSIRLLEREDLKKSSFSKEIIEKICRTLLLFLVLLMIGATYYFYIYVRIININL
jgi:hypothetical protein